MKENELFELIKDLLDIHTDITYDENINLFECDSFTKVNIIIALESYSDNAIELEAFLECESFGALINLANKMKNEKEAGTVYDEWRERNI